MNLKGKHAISAKPAVIWPLLQDPIVLARITPGVSRLELTGPDQYKAISDISIGPVRGSFAGDLEVREKDEEKCMTLAFNLKSKIGNAQSEIKIELTPQSEEVTELSFNGTAKLSGTIARMGQRILGGVLNTLSRQVFKKLEQEVQQLKKQDQQDITQPNS